MFWFGQRNSWKAYYPGEMSIYHYWNGKQWVKADPMTLYKRVMEVGPEMSVDIKVANSISKDNLKAHDNLLKKIRDIFNVEPLEEGGLSETATANLLDHFLIYCETVKKNSKLSPTLSTSEALAPSSEDAPTTSPTSDSGSTVSACSIAEPPALPTESVSPSVS